MGHWGFGPLGDSGDSVDVFEVDSVDLAIPLDLDELEMSFPHVGFSQLVTVYTD